MENKPRIKWKNFKIWFKDQIKRKTWFRNFFITRNAWGAFSINSHINQHTDNPNKHITILKLLLNQQKRWDRNTTHISVHINVYTVMVIILERIEITKQIMTRKFEVKDKTLIFK